MLHSAGIELLGQGGGSVPDEAFDRMAIEIIPELLAMLAMLAHRTIAIDTVTRSLADVTDAWTRAVPSGTRTVLVPG